MRIFSRSTLRDFWTLHPQAEAPLREWFKEVDGADWGEPQDVKRRHASASFVGSDRIVFNIGGNNYRLIVKVRYEARVVYIRFLGTHAQYNRVNAAEV